MDELDKNLPDDFWRKTFEDASEAPPPRVWATIEQRLDESSGPKVLPLWGTGPASSRILIWGSGIAAAVALLFVGWWAVNSQSTTQSVTQVQPVNQANHIADSRSQPSESTATLPADNARPAQADAAVSTTTKLVAKSGQPIDGSEIQSANKASHDAQPLLAQTYPNLSRDIHSRNVPAVLSAASTAIRTMESPESGFSSRSAAAASYTSGGRSFTANDVVDQNAVVAFNKLNGKPMRMRRLGSIQRIVWIRPVEIVTEPEINKSKRQPRELWASVSMMPGSFNPMVSVRPVQSSFSNTAVASANVPTHSSVNSRANYSVAYQAGAGVQLNDRWSVESGIGYLSGHATVETSGQYLTTGQMDLLANRIGTGSNAYIDALRNSSQTVKSANSAPQASYNNIAYVSPSYVPSSNQNLQTVNNDYQYVQVPVQVGYQLRPRKKLSMAVIGGILTNIFVKNTVGDALVVTNKDGVYRPVSLAATMGARLRYRPSRQWSASVAGVYQPSLESSTKSDAQVQGHPTSAGMSFGVDYHF
ncbi:hypothetical protein SD10_27200 [Spirosoma radiotolerans]|uniref:Outer membrane protein beta-barrel domain-containing protein n=2 Tax=Spirosoma radiotolerans TaxID=1379870 RepID=A0A0E3ZZL6_9BACT|nr:hypothetical protein SD10_27200 [Spirosoma radiotolerans]